MPSSVFYSSKGENSPSHRQREANFLTRENLEYVV